VITCFAGVPDYQELSVFASRMHERWGQRADPIQRRRSEDAAAMAYLGADYTHWHYLDCIYRRATATGKWLYATESSLFGSVRPEDHDLVLQVADRATASLQPDGVRIYAPLVSRHVDHQIVLLAALELQDRGYQVEFYEDYPYAEEAHAISRALAAWSAPPTPHRVLLCHQDLDARIGAISLYSSQLAVLFGDESLVRQRVTAYVLSVGQRGNACERYWRGGRK
jgi:LmbE family N-acetylglucosaminyl deacetylase